MNRYSSNYSSRKNPRVLSAKVDTVVQQKKLAFFGKEWRQVSGRIIAVPAAYVDEYHQRELTESYLAAE